ncbi:anaphase-promoting complex subunit cdc27 [Exophiala xenobiotica]|uniref:Anaphase-promoting complex subunit cdc27 n=1 Tax=Lithohypha guttulata TaxID=1690604 RepID=A0ABR0JXI0_9EURO|nr:anaphase-promoting complex subunit cdc27 [Lithohypha guttulata]KAK5313586.1 anaphase-promoting complex subunit cdc27 [Exophiala xenobiotica]
MAPTTTSSSPSSQLRQLVYYHLDNNLLKNALFLAQRLVAYEPRNAEAAFLLAHCQFQCGYTKASWDTSRLFAVKGSHLGCAYIFAQACLELGRYIDGVQALDKSRPLWQTRNTLNQHSESRRQHLPDAAAVLCLKGKLWKGHKNMDFAVDCWVNSLKLNPFMWDAYTLLVESGAKVNVPAIYRLNPEMVNMLHAQYAANEKVQERPIQSASIPPPPLNQQSMPDPFMSTQKTNGHPNALFEKLNNSKINISTANNIHDDEIVPTPSTVVDEDNMMQNGNGNARYEAPPAPLRKTKSTLDAQQDPTRLKSASTRLKSRLKQPGDESHHEPPPPGPPSKRTISGAVAPSQLSEPVRRTTRSQTSRPPSATSTNKMSSMANSLGLRQERDIKRAKAPAVKPRTATAATVGRAVSGNRMKTAPSAEPSDLESRENRAPSVPSLPAMLEQPPPQQESRVEKDIEALRTLLDLFHRLASAHYSLSHFDCQSAIQVYNSLPSTHRETPYVLSQIARAYNEMSQHAEAEKYFIRVRQAAPSRLEDMEIYSTVLYQLKSEIELAYLAHELVEVERNSPQTWIAIGNSFSLQREHEQALKCFRRATQLDPSFAYGFTLQGHEYIENEEFTKALEAYRCAIAADNRHYNAWYGLGKVYTKLGKYSVAESHYRTAATINPSNAVLTCAIGTVVERTKPLDQALKFYDKACRLAPKNALSRFKKARCLMGLGRPEEALSELEVLKEIAPDEANVWFLSGRLCKMLGRKGEAVRAFTVALNLDPKAAQYIKDAMESLDDEEDIPDADGDEDMD